MTANGARYTHEIKCSIVMVKEAFNKKKTLFASKLGLNFGNNLVKCYIRSIVCYGSETWIRRKVDQKYLGRYEMWCCRRMEKISWTDHVRNEKCYTESRR